MLPASFRHRIADPARSIWGNPNDALDTSLLDGLCHDASSFRLVDDLREFSLSRRRSSFRQGHFVPRAVHLMRVGIFPYFATQYSPSVCPSFTPALGSKMAVYLAVPRIPRDFPVP